jgi:hypothetical protein
MPYGMDGKKRITSLMGKKFFKILNLENITLKMLHFTMAEHGRELIK